MDELVEAARRASKKMERVPVTALRFGFRPVSEEREAQNVQSVSSIRGGGVQGDELLAGEAGGGGGGGGKGTGGCALLRVYPAKCILKGGFKGKHIIRVAVVGEDDEELDQDTSSFITEPRLAGVPGCDKFVSPEVGGEGDANFWQEVRIPLSPKQPTTFQGFVTRADSTLSRRF